MAKSPATSSPAIFIRRLDTITFELVQVRDGKESVILREAFPYVHARALNILQRMAEGSYND